MGAWRARRVLELRRLGLTSLSREGSCIGTADFSPVSEVRLTAEAVDHETHGIGDTVQCQRAFYRRRISVLEVDQLTDVGRVWIHLDVEHVGVLRVVVHSLMTEVDGGHVHRDCHGNGSARHL